VLRWGAVLQSRMIPRNGGAREKKKKKKRVFVSGGLFGFSYFVSFFFLFFSANATSPVLLGVCLSGEN
jgi:hypothetical protein